MKVIALLVSVFAISTSAISGSAWTVLIDRFAAQLSNELENGSVYVMPIVDSSSNEIYLPFANQLKTVLTSSLEANQAVVTTSHFDYKYLLRTSFTKSKEGLFLNSIISDKNGNETSNFLELKSTDLPTYWNQRKLKDVVYEIAGKLEKELSGQKLNVVNKGLSGGSFDNDGYISDFTVLMNRNLTEELSDISSIVVRKNGDSSFNLHDLEGKFKLSGKNIFLNYFLINKDNNKVVATASTEFSIELIPPGMSIFPVNKDIVRTTFDSRSTTNKTPVAVWVNHDNSIYRDGDKLEVSIRPDIDAYIRAFYVMSDGVICQILPTSKDDPSLLTAGSVFTIGDKNDDVELYITDETKGQETIKVFASLTPIKDEFLPTKYIDGVDYACTEDGYKSLKKGITMGLGTRGGISPANEVKILVK